MEPREQRRHRHPKEGWTFALALLVILPLGALALATAVFWIWFVPLIPLLLWFSMRAFFAALMGNAVEVNEFTFPEIHRLIEKRRAFFHYRGDVRCFVVPAEGYNAVLFMLFGRKVIILPDDLVDDDKDGRKVDFIVSRFIAALAARRFRLAWAGVFLSAVEGFAVFNLLLYPYERAVQLSGDRVALVALDGDMEASVDTLIGFLGGGKLISRVNPLGVGRQARAVSRTFFGWLTRALSPHPHTVQRVAELVAFARERYPDKCARYLESRGAGPALATTERAKAAYAMLGVEAAAFASRTAGASPEPAHDIPRLILR